MEIELLQAEEFTANCYILTDGDSVAVIDPGIYYQKAKEALKKAKNKYILLTHAHFDHILGLPKLKQETGAKVVISKTDSIGLKADNPLSLAKETGNNFVETPADILVEDGSVIPFFDDEIKVIATPGHTEGSVCFSYKGNLFSGDTLFCNTIGRTDLPTGNMFKLLKSLKKLSELDENTVVYPGHDEWTTIKDEKAFNPYMKRI